MNREPMLRRRIRWLTGCFIFGLFVSGATAIPLAGELNLLVTWFGADGATSGLAVSGEVTGKYSTTNMAHSTSKAWLVTRFEYSALNVGCSMLPPA